MPEAENNPHATQRLWSPPHTATVHPPQFTSHTLYYLEVPAYVAMSNDTALPSHHKAENDFSTSW
jgi:hypothetical protein